MLRTPAEIVIDLKILAQSVDQAIAQFPSANKKGVMHRLSNTLHDAAETIKQLTTVKPCTCPNPPADQIVPHAEGCPERVLP